MPIVQIDLLPRSVEQKRQMAKEITDSIVRIAQCPPSAVKIIFRDMPRENYSDGGVLNIDK